MNRDYVLTELRVSYNRTAKHPLTKELTKQATAARSVFYKHTLSWGTDGIQLLPVPLFDRFDRTMQHLVTAFGETARRAGYGMLSGMQCHYMPFPADAEHLPYALPIKRQLMQDVKRRLFYARCDLVAKIEATIESAHDRMIVDYVQGVAYPRKFHDTLFTLILDACDLFSVMNIDQSPAIDEVITKLRALASEHEPSAVRRNAAIRTDLANRLNALYAVLSNA
jgi:hypothetical protein